MKNGKTPKKKKSPEEDRVDEKRDERSPLERLAEFTRRIVAVPKEEVTAERTKAERRKKRP